MMRSVPGKSSQRKGWFFPREHVAVGRKRSETIANIVGSTKSNRFRRDRQELLSLSIGRLEALAASSHWLIAEGGADQKIFVFTKA
jgi:hypothetical protein